MTLTGLDANPWIACVHRGIQSDLRFVLKHQRWGAVMTLTYAGMDAMSYTTVPIGQPQTRQHFIEWTERYMTFPPANPVTGLELYGARCAVLHTYGTESDLSKSGKCRVVLHVVTALDRLAMTAPEHPDAVAVNVPRLALEFLDAVDRYGDEANRDPDRWALVERRLAEFNHLIPMESL